MQNGVPLSVTEAGAPAVNHVWDNDGSIVVNDSSTDFVLNGTTGTAFLQSRTFPVGEQGTPAEGLYGIEWRIHMYELKLGTSQPCVKQLSIDTGSGVKLDYNSDGNVEDVYMVTSGGIGDVKLQSATRFGSMTRFVFAGAGVCSGSGADRGQSSFFFGTTSQYAARDVSAAMVDSAAVKYQLGARAPAHP